MSSDQIDKFIEKRRTDGASIAKIAKESGQSYATIFNRLQAILKKAENERLEAEKDNEPALQNFCAEITLSNKKDEFFKSRHVATGFADIAAVASKTIKHLAKSNFSQQVRDGKAELNLRIIAIS